jgi:hypothetical protein
MMKLYNVNTIVKQYGGCKEVRFAWFRCPGDHNRKPRPYAECILNYDPRDELARYAEGAVDELFTLTEANALKEYLDREHGHEGVTTIEEQDLPIANDTIGVAGMPVGGGHDHYMLDKEPQYALWFRVNAYFNLVGCELLDAPGSVYHHRLLLVSRDGARMETNDEAALRERQRPVKSSSATLGKR